MKKGFAPTAVLLLAAMSLAGGCADKSAKERVERDRTEWKESLKDSLSATRAELDSTRARVGRLRARTDELLSHFRCVENPREVEKYYLPEVRGYEYPLKSNGLAARLLASEQLEIVAAYIGAPFDAVRICGNAQIPAELPKVPHDQGLNYRSANMTTVAFSGNEVDSVAARLKDLKAPVRIDFLSDGKQVGRCTLTAPQYQALRLAAGLADSRRETLLAERRLMVLNRKIQILETN